MITTTYGKDQGAEPHSCFQSNRLGAKIGFNEIVNSVVMELPCNGFSFFIKVY